MSQKTYSRRRVGKLGIAAAVGLSAPFLGARTANARDAKLVFWLQPNFNKVADDLLVAQTWDYARLRGLSRSDVQIETVPGGEVAKRMAAALDEAVALLTDGRRMDWARYARVLRCRTLRVAFGRLAEAVVERARAVDGLDASDWEWGLYDAEAGHLALANGEPAEAWLALAQARPQALRHVADAVARLGRAVEAGSSGGRVWRGEALMDVPAAYRPMEAPPCDSRP